MQLNTRRYQEVTCVDSGVYRVLQLALHLWQVALLFSPPRQRIEKGGLLARDSGQRHLSALTNVAPALL